MNPEVIDASPVPRDGDRGTVPGLAFELRESKFHPPGIRPGIVVRTALLRRLAATRVPVITLAAPPGYGKTTLMAQWAQRTESRVAWLSCVTSRFDCCSGVPTHYPGKPPSSSTTHPLAFCSGASVAATDSSISFF